MVVTGPNRVLRPKKVQNPQKYVKIGYFWQFYVKTAYMWPNLDELASNVLFGCFWPNLAILVALYGHILYPWVPHTPKIHSSVPDTYTGKKRAKKQIILGLNLDWLKIG